LHARRVESDRGSIFIRCAQAEKDSRFPKYPRLPVRECEGYEPATGRPLEPFTPG